MGRTYHKNRGLGGRETRSRSGSHPDCRTVTMNRGCRCCPCTSSSSFLVVAQGEGVVSDGYQ
eukprot:13010441-Ditylum_brightwellii.AAC.1